MKGGGACDIVLTISTVSQPDSEELLRERTEGFGHWPPADMTPRLAPAGRSQCMRAPCPSVGGGGHNAIHSSFN